MKKIEIIEGSIEEVVSVSDQIPELIDPYTGQEYKNRLHNRLSLILVAKDGDKPVGFKLGYEMETHFYSWLGGVIPDYRKKGIATLLAQYQENWVKEKGFEGIVFKTLNRYRAMLIFSIKRGFTIKGTEPYDKEDGLKIILEKSLKNNE